MINKNLPSIQILDEYLLNGNVSRQSIDDAIQMLKSSLRSDVSAQWGLSQDLPDDDDDLFEAMLHLQVQIAYPMKVSPSFIRKMSMICRINRVIQSYVKGKLRLSRFESQISAITRVESPSISEPGIESEDQRCSDDIEIMLFDFRYKMAMIGMPIDQGGIKKECVVDLCVITSNRLCAYWHAILG